jgi:hypothetical protein
MSTPLLPPGTRAVVQYAGPRPEATQIAWLILESRTGSNFRQEVVGCLTYHPEELADPLSRLSRWKRRMALRTPLGYTMRNVSLDAMAKEHRRMTDLQRFSRKMGQVLRIYEAEKMKALRGELGLPEMAMERLDHELELAWQKAERIYGCKREDFNPRTK